MKEYMQKIIELSNKITDMAEISIEFDNQDSALASIADIEKIAEEIKTVAKNAQEPPF